MTSAKKTVYTVDAKTNLIDIWECIGEFCAPYQGEKEKLCILRQGRKECVLPKRCVFTDPEKALAAAKSGN